MRRLTIALFLTLAVPAAAAPAPYKGVAPGAGNLPPKAPKVPVRRGPQKLTWPGFEIRDGIPTVFIEVTGTPQYQVTPKPGALVVTLHNTVVPLRNNRRPLDVGSFGTQVQKIEAHAHGHTTQVVIETKGNATPTYVDKVEPAAGGYQMVLIQLPAPAGQ